MLGIFVLLGVPRNHTNEHNAKSKQMAVVALNKGLTSDRLKSMPDSADNDI